MAVSQGFKRLFFDIETSPNVGFFWEAGYDKQIPYDNIIKERAIICICYKWEGKDKVYSLNWDANQCDKKLLKEFIKVAESADELIGHNGDKFDLKWIRTRCLIHNIRMMPEYTTVDTLKVARSKFKFNSNRLDYIAKFLGHGGKNNNSGFGLWREVIINKSKKGLAEMLTYCKNDVVILEKVFTSLNNYIKQKSHVGVIEGEYKWSCPKCGGNVGITMISTYVSAAGNSSYYMLHKKDGCFHKFKISAATYRAKKKHEIDIKRKKY
jgi:uncharacterized protein YprB with RNaseH-like and TPR domain